MCHLCQDAEKLFDKMRRNYAEPTEACHVLTIALIHCIEATQTSPAQQFNMVSHITEILTGFGQQETVH